MKKSRYLHFSKWHRTFQMVVAQWPEEVVDVLSMIFLISEQMVKMVIQWCTIALSTKTVYIMIKVISIFILSRVKNPRLAHNHNGVADVRRQILADALKSRGTKVGMLSGSTTNECVYTMPSHRYAQLSWTLLSNLRG